MQDIEDIRTQLEISRLKARHLRFLDTRAWPEYAAMLTEDFVLDMGQGGEIPVIHGRDAAVKQVQASVEGMVTVHQAHMPEFEWKDDAVHVIWAMHDRVIRGAEEPSYTVYGHHHDRWVRRDGEWKLAALRLTTLHLDVHAPGRPSATRA